MCIRLKMSEIATSEFDDRLRNEVEKVGLFSVEKIVLMSNEEFLELGNFTINDIKIIKDAAAKKMSPAGFRRVSIIEDNLKRKWRTIRSESYEIDELLGGGIPIRGITELSGESGTGKTQFCLQYSITVQYPVEEGGLNRGAVYICTEDRFPSLRLHQLLQYFPRRSFECRDFENHNFSDNIYVVHIASVDCLKDCLNRKLPKMLEKTRCGLVVIDSIAAIFRGDYSVEQSVTRAKDLREIGLRLHKMSRYFSLAILCVNQVTDVIDCGSTVPALGLAWANLVTTKLQLRNSPERNRTFHVLSAPHIPPGSVPYKIEASGVVT